MSSGIHVARRRRTGNGTSAATIGAMVVLAVMPVASAGAAAPAGPRLPSGAPTGPTAVPGEIVVGYRVGVNPSERAEARSAADVRARRNLLVRGAQLVKVESGQTVGEAIAALEKRPDVRFAEPNWIYQASSTAPHDPRFGSLWGLSNTGQTVNGRAGTADADIDAPEAWDVNRGSASTVVAVVDSGVAFEHPDLAPNIWSNPGEIPDNGTDDDDNGKIDDVRGWDFGGDDNNPWDYTDHGTHVAGTIAARGDNGMGVAGVAWQASIMPVRALNASGSGSNADITDAFTYAAANGAKVVNASLGGPAFSQAMSDAITNHPNTLFVVSAGNAAQNNDTTPAYPCNYTAANLICVAATDNTDALAGFSNYGSTSVDLAAPGVDTDSARPHYTSPDAFGDDFESGLDKWTVQSGPWGTRSVIGSTWLLDSPAVGANYINGADWAIRTSSKIDLGTRTDCALKFRYGTFLRAGDWLELQSSTDDTAWPTLVTIGNTTGAVRAAGVELGAAGNRYYRYRLTSNASSVWDGVYIDNVRVACPGLPYGSDDYQFLSGTSMASPHVAGAAAVLFSAQPSATVAEVKAALLDTGDPLDGLTGKTVSGRRLNLDTALTSPAVRADTTTAISSDGPDPSVVGEAVTVHYSVAVDAAGSGTPTGNVTVSAGTDSCTGTVAAGQCTLTFTTAGPRSLTVAYTGNAYYNPSPASSSVSHQVNRADTRTTITSDDFDPSLVGETVPVSFTVIPVEPGAGTPTGAVTVSDGVDSCTAAVADGGCDINLTTGGARSLTATYAGTANFNRSTSPSEPHTVNRLATTTTLSSADPDPSVVGQAVSVRYSVSPTDSLGTPTGNVTVSDGSASCTATVAAGQCTLTFTRAGATSLSARYAGDTTFSASSSAFEAHTVGSADTATTISADAPDPSVAGQPVTVRYRIAPSAPGAGTPTGNVTVSDGVHSCTADAAAGRCRVTLTTIGTRTLTAGYTGDDNFHGSTSAGETHTVKRPATVTPPPPPPPRRPGGLPPAAPPPSPPPAAAAVMGLQVPGLSVFGRAGSRARCRMRNGSIRSCRVRLLAGRRVLARGSAVSNGARNRSLRVTLELTRFGRTLLARRLGGVRARIRARAATTGGARRARARTRAILRVERFTTPAGAWAPGRARLTARGRGFVRGLSGRLVAVASLRCDGHDASVRTDSVTTSRLSVARAAVMCRALDTLGAGSPRTRVVGHGDAEPIASNTTRSGRARNRRVEVTITHRRRATAASGASWRRLTPPLIYRWAGGGRSVRRPSYSSAARARAA